MITEKQEQTYWARIYMSGPMEVAKQTIRAECLRAGLCVTVEPTTFIYTGGEESGYVVGLIQYPRFPSHPVAIEDRARDLMEKLLEATHQQSALLMTPNVTTWITKRQDQAGNASPRSDEKETTGFGRILGTMARESGFVDWPALSALPPLPGEASTDGVPPSSNDQPKGGA